MGWLFYAHSRRQLIADRIKTEETDRTKWETLRHCTVGNVLWRVRRTTRKQTGEVNTIICCDLLQKGIGGRWGYKGLTESMGPYYYSCPLAYLDLADTDRNEEWRKGVRAYHERQAERRKRTRSIFRSNLSIGGGTRMKTYRFEVATHTEHGTLGFRPKWYPNGDPLAGMAVAHDILEHFPNDDGSVEGELQALGAALFIRGDSGYFQRNGNPHSPEVHLAADFPMLWDYLRFRDGRTMVKPCHKVRDSDLMDRCRGVVRQAITDLRANDWDTLPSSACQELMACWLAKGYKRAEKRYQGDSFGVAYGLFARIESEADKALKYAEEGMVLTVAVDFTRRHATVECDYPADDSIFLS